MAHKRHYRAFISYSHADRAVAQWLHRALETYRMPRRLVGEETAIGTVPSRLTPIFRDRDELSAAGSLTEELRDALLESDFLIVVASPAAASSHWVNEEIRLFKAMHGEAHVLALIAASNPGERGSGGAFPPALRFHVGDDGVVTDQMAEPIAADIRPGRDGRRLAKLKLVAGLTGLPLDALVQREAQRRQRWLAGIATASLALVAVMAVLTIFAIQGQREAERQRAEADGLVEFMLTDLRRKLEPVGRLEVLDAVGQRAMAYYGAQDLDRLDADALGRRARALMLVGEVRDLRGNRAEALASYREAERATAELLARAPNDPERLFDHAQSVFYVGQLAWQRGDWTTAEDRFRDYDQLAAALLTQDPDNPRWQLERHYAHQALGALYRETRRYPQAEAQFRQALAQSAALLRASPDDADRLWEAGQSHGWLSDALKGQGRLAEAAASREAELDHYARVQARDPAKTNAIISRGVALDALADLHLMEGDLPAALARSEAAVDLLERQFATDPSNALWLEVLVGAVNLNTEVQLLSGNLAAAAAANRRGLGHAARLTALDDEATLGHIRRARVAQALEVAIAFARGDRSGGQALADRLLAASAAAPRETESARDTWHLMMVHMLSPGKPGAAGGAPGGDPLRAEMLRLGQPPRSLRESAWLAAYDPRLADPDTASGYPVAQFLKRTRAD